MHATKDQKNESALIEIDFCSKQLQYGRSWETVLRSRTTSFPLLKPWQLTRLIKTCELSLKTKDYLGFVCLQYKNHHSHFVIFIENVCSLMFRPYQWHLNHESWTRLLCASIFNSPAQKHFKVVCTKRRVRIFSKAQCSYQSLVQIRGINLQNRI